ncbi:MAG: hypothetical protein GEU71_17990 [Actinobacteria bacterium]|nr:hypothetical protein [Actinomycetota bacterium]
MHLNGALGGLARKQAGHLMRGQCRKYGMSDDQIRYRRREAAWRQVLPGVYRLPGVPNSFENDLIATNLWLGDRGYFFGGTAAFVLGLDGIAKPRAIEVAIRRGSGAPGIEAHRFAADSHPRTRRVMGLRLPSTELMLLECAATLPVKSVGRAMDDALRRRMTSVARLRAFVADNAARGRGGTRAMRQLIAGRDPDDERVRSLLETRMLRILRRIEGLQFLPDHPIRVAGRRYVIDFFLPAPSIGIECHSRRWHGVESSHGDIRRHRTLAGAGIELLYFDWDDVTFTPDETEQEIRAAVARRLAPPGSLARTALRSGSVRSTG